MCNTIQTTECSNVKEKENLNVLWVQRLCSGEGDPVNKEDVKSVMSRSLPKLGLPQFDSNPLEWPTFISLSSFISLFKCLVHDQPLTDTQRMTHLQCALDGNAKRAIGGMFTHGHLYREALKELEEQFGNEEAVAGAYLKTIFDHPEVSEGNFAQLRSFYNILHIAVSTLKSLSYEHDLAATDNLRRAVQKLAETVKTRWGEKRVETLSKKTTLADLDVCLRKHVHAKSMISDQALNNGSKRVMTRPSFRRRKGRDPPPRSHLNGTEISALTTTVNANRETPRTPIVCPVCSHADKVEDCPEFKELNVD